MSIKLDDIRLAAQEELREEAFRVAVDREKQRIREQDKSLWQRILGFRIQIKFTF